MSIYHFTIVVRDASSDLADLEDQFFEAGCEDALLCQYNGTLYLEIEEQGFSTLAEMAERAGMSRQVLSLYAQNKQGNGNFLNRCMV